MLGKLHVPGLSSSGAKEAMDVQQRKRWREPPEAGPQASHAQERWGDKCLGEVQSWSHRVCERETSLPVPFLNARREGIKEGALHDQKA